MALFLEDFSTEYDKDVKKEIERNKIKREWEYDA